MNKKFVILGSIILILLLLAVGSGVVGLLASRLPFRLPAEWTEGLGGKTPPVGQLRVEENGTIKVASEESVVIDVVKRVSPAVVTVGITTTRPIFGYEDDPFGFFYRPVPQGTREIKQDIGSGFIVRSDGVVVTNKHVVSETGAKYRVITTDNKSFEVERIYRDPNNDLAILKINATGLPTAVMGDSDKIQVGQFAIAIGTALGEFRSTVTTGVVSGVGRGIIAGSPYSDAEKLENVIQTDAAINPGNSGGPLLNSAGQVIGVNVAVAAEAENIGFALPINTVKTLVSDFQAGKIREKAYLGVSYRMVTRDLAVLNEIPEGAYVEEVISGSPAEKGGIVVGDIITRFDGKLVRESDGGLAKIIGEKKPGDSVEVVVFRGETTKTLRVSLVAVE